MENSKEIFIEYLKDTFGGEKEFRNKYNDYLIFPIRDIRQKFQGDHVFWSLYERAFDSPDFQTLIQLSV